MTCGGLHDIKKQLQRKTLKVYKPTLGIDPIIFTPTSSQQRSRLLRWRLGKISSGNPSSFCHSCSQQPGFSRAHIINCRFRMRYSTFILHQLISIISTSLQQYKKRYLQKFSLRSSLCTQLTFSATTTTDLIPIQQNHHDHPE